MQQNVISTLNELSQRAKLLTDVESHFHQDEKLHHATARCYLPQPPNGNVIVCTHKHQIKEVARQIAAFDLLQNQQFQELTKKFRE